MEQFTAFSRQTTFGASSCLPAARDASVFFGKEFATNINNNINSLTATITTNATKLPATNKTAALTGSTITAFAFISGTTTTPTSITTTPEPTAEVEGTPRGCGEAFSHKGSF